MSYTPRRLRKKYAPKPRTFIKTEHPLTAEQAADIKRKWLLAARSKNPLILAGDIRVTDKNGRVIA